MSRVSKAKGVGETSTTNAVSVLSTAPKAITSAPPSPAAVPANAGRTDKVPALALGSVRPLPRPMKSVRPNSASGCEAPAANTPRPSTMPTKATTRPATSSTPPPAGVPAAR